VKVLKSHRDGYFHQWNEEDWASAEEVSTVATFGYVSIKQMQRGDVTVQSQSWLKEHEKENARLLKLLRESMPTDGMFSPFILVHSNHGHWKRHVDKHFWLTIPFIIHSGNNRFQVAVENGYTHISSVMLGASVDPRVFKYLQEELKKPLSQKIKVSKDFIRHRLGERI